MKNGVQFKKTKILFLTSLVLALTSVAEAANTCWMSIYTNPKQQIILTFQKDVFAGYKILHFSLPNLLPNSPGQIEFGRITKSDTANQLDSIEIYPEGLDLNAPQAIYQSINVNLRGFDYEKGMKKLEIKTLMSGRVFPKAPSLLDFKGATFVVDCRKD